MNEYYYYTLIIPFIPKIERHILTKRDIHLIILKSRKQRLIMFMLEVHVFVIVFVVILQNVK